VPVVVCRPFSVTQIPANLSVLSPPFPPDAYGTPNWKEEYGPTLIRRGGQILVDTKFTRLTGKPPVILPGMTPTTSFHGIDLVAACNSAGFHGELAAGGLPLPEYFTAKVSELVAKQPPGTGVTINMLYLNAYLWGFQFPLVCDMATQGIPIESITIAAGVPSPSVAEEILQKLSASGISYVSLKPGSADAIREVLVMAKVAKPLNMSVCIRLKIFTSRCWKRTRRSVGTPTSFSLWGRALEIGKPLFRT